MLGFEFSAEKKALQHRVAAIDRVQAVIEFDLQGTILDANTNFLNAMGYRLEEIKGKHHSMFVDPAYAASADYRSFWEKLRKGEFSAGEFSRLAKGNREVWLQASYNPVLDRKGVAYKVVKFATDITAQKQLAADHAGQIAAINKAQAVIQFDLNGTILDANANFLATMGYGIDEIKGKHHSLFVDPDYARSEEYRAFWQKLRNGEYSESQYRRLGKGGREIWLQASYNPILDASGRPYKVVKFATDITQRVAAAQMMQNAVQQTQAVMQAAKVNDLTQHISLDDKQGELLTLCQGVNDLIDSMAGVIANLKDASGNIAAASDEISGASMDLAQRTESQAASLEETAASMHEITTTVRQNADNAQTASQLATKARTTAQEGGEVAQQAVDAVRQIEESAGKIVNIVGLIDEIAFQTNLLALNASVEAARAGEAGKGFAVVAQEVRALAQRSANASKEIKGLIHESNAQVKTGASLVNKAGQSLTEIVSSVKSVADIVAEIAAASSEQSSGLDQINTAVGNMDEMTQRNGALVEETSASAQTLANQAAELDALVQRYKINADPVATPASGANRQPAVSAKPKQPAAPASPPRGGPQAPVKAAASAPLGRATPTSAPLGRAASAAARPSYDKPKAAPPYAAGRSTAAAASDDEWTEF